MICLVLRVCKVVLQYMSWIDRTCLSHQTVILLRGKSISRGGMRVIHIVSKYLKSPQYSLIRLQYFHQHTAAILHATLHYIRTTLSSHQSTCQLEPVHFESGKRERHHFQTHYDWTAVPLGTFQNQQSLAWHPLTATAGSWDSVTDTPHYQHISIWHVAGVSAISGHTSW